MFWITVCMVLVWLGLQGLVLYATWKAPFMHEPYTLAEQQLKEQLDAKSKAKANAVSKAADVQ